MLQANKAIVTQFINAIGAADVETIEKLAARDFVLVTAGKAKVSGTHDLADLIKVFDSFFKVITGRGIRFEILNLTAEEDRVSCEARGYAKLVNGADYNNEYHFLVTLRDGKVSRVVEYLDTQLTDTVVVPLMAKLQ